MTGVTGQDGCYLAEFLLGQGYTVPGIKRRSSSFNTDRVDRICQTPHIVRTRFNLHYDDLRHGISVACKKYLEVVGR